MGTYEHFALRASFAKGKLASCIGKLRCTQYDAEDNGYQTTEARVKALADKLDACMLELVSIEQAFNEAAEASFTTEGEW